jgi:hypothetical protein
VRRKKERKWEDREQRNESGEKERKCNNGRKGADEALLVMV